MSLLAGLNSIFRLPNIYLQIMSLWEEGKLRMRRHKRRPKFRVASLKSEEANGSEELEGTCALLRGPGSSHKPIKPLDEELKEGLALSN